MRLKKYDGLKLGRHRTSIAGIRFLSYFIGSSCIKRNYLSGIIYFDPCSFTNDIDHHVKHLTGKLSNKFQKKKHLCSMLKFQDINNITCAAPAS